MAGQKTPSIEGFKAAAEITKQIIALSTGAVAFTVTFLEKFSTAEEGKSLSLPAGLYWTWILFGVAIGFAIFNLMGITGTLESIDRSENGWPLSKEQKAAAEGSTDHLRWPAMLMFAAFFGAVVAMIVTGFAIAG